MSKQGRKVLSELRNVIQATLQFGMEKNGMGRPLSHVKSVANSRIR